MTVRLAPALLVLGLLAAIFGGVMGLTPMSRDSTTCGSVFSPNTSAALKADLTRAFEADAGTASVPAELSQVENACDSARSDRKPMALVGLIAGGALVLCSLVVFGKNTWADQETQKAAPTTSPEGL